MPEHLRALVVILFLSTAVFWIAERAMCGLLITRTDFRRRRNIWLGVTLIAFFSHSFWLYAALMTALLVSLSARERNPFALYCLLLLALPSLDARVPGLGVVNYLVSLNHVRLLNLIILLPLALRLAAAGNHARPHSRVPDYLVAAYLLYIAGMQLPADSLTGNMRNVFGLLVDVWLVYYVASRSLPDLTRAKDTIASFVLGVAVIAPIAAFEALRGWLVYSGLRGALDLTHSAGLGTYIFRGDEGLLRANVTAGNAIVLGYVFMVAIAMMIFLSRFIQPRTMRVLALAVLCAGIVAALSRGPWVGAAVGLIIGMGLGPGAPRRWTWIAAVGIIGTALLLATPFGTTVLDHLPFVGTVDSGNIDYRQRLYEVSMYVFWQNPIFGALNYIGNPLLEEMRQGQGIIDMVNSYLVVALAYGFVGLALFLAPFAYAIVIVWRRRREFETIDLDAERMGRALLAATLAILVTIGTVSSIGIVPTLYTLVTGMCVAYGLRMASAGEQRASVTRAPRTHAAPSPRADFGAPRGR